MVWVVFESRGYQKAMAKIPRPVPANVDRGGRPCAAMRSLRGTSRSTAAAIAVLLSICYFYILGSDFALRGRDGRDLRPQFPQVYSTQQSAWSVEGVQPFDRFENKGMWPQAGLPGLGTAAKAEAGLGAAAKAETVPAGTAAKADAGFGAATKAEAAAKGTATKAEAAPKGAAPKAAPKGAAPKATPKGAAPKAAPKGAAPKVAPKGAASKAAAASKAKAPVLCKDKAPAVDEMLAKVNIFADNLDKDFSVWAKGYTLEDIQATATAAHILRPEAAFLVKISGGKVTLPQMPNGECEGFCSERIKAGLHQMRQAIEFGRFSPPDSLFIWNVWDQALCTTIKCTAPVLSLSKLEGKRGTVKDILVPHPMFTPIDSPTKVAWDEKEEVAWWRGAPDCTGNPHKIKGKEVECSRSLLPKLSRTRPDMDVVSDVEFPEEAGTNNQADQLAKYKYLFSLDGRSASHQLGQMLSSNSLVLKQESQNIEYFYGSLKPCVHYIPFWEKNEKDVNGVLDALPHQDALAKKIVANAQAFASRHLNGDAHWRYWEEVLRRLNSNIKASTKHK